jgi:hypothetical protein
MPEAASLMSGLPVNATIFVSDGKTGALKKFIGHFGISECLKLRHHSLG